MSSTITIAQSQWFSRPADQRFETLGDLHASVSRRRNLSRAFDVEMSNLRAEPQGEQGLLISGDAVPSTPSHWAFGQLGQIVKAPPAYLRTLPAPLAASCLNASLDRLAGQTSEIKLMTVRDEEGDAPDTLQAVTSRVYGRIWDADVVEAVQRIVERSGGRFHNPLDWSRKGSGLYASDHDCFLFMIDGGSIVEGGGERDQLHRGFIVSNSETGARTFSLMTFLFRGCCGNHLIWGAKDVTKLIVRHTFAGPTRFDKEAMPALLSYVDAAAKPAEDAVRAAKDTPLKGLVNVPGLTVTDTDKLGDDWVAEFSRRHKFTRGEVKDAIRFARAEEGKCASLWDLVNGFTASARAIEFVDARVDLEKRAGKLMDLAKN